MDPVCCLTCYPRLLFSFLYKTYSLREAVSSLAGFANIARFFISRDLIIAEVRTSTPSLWAEKSVMNLGLKIRILPQGPPLPSRMA